MKSRLILPLLLVVFLAANSMVAAQDSKQKKIERIQRKIEKETKKLQELTGEEAIVVEGMPLGEEDMERIREEARAQADEARARARELREEMQVMREEQRQLMREHAERLRDKHRELEDEMLIIRERAADALKDAEEIGIAELDKLKDIEIDIKRDMDGKQFHYYYKTPQWSTKEGREIVIAEPDIKIGIPEMKGGAYNFYTETEDVLSIQKSLNDESGSSDFSYEVKEGSNGLSVKVSGEIESGRVKVTIKKPNGEVYNDYTLSPLAGVDWKHTVRFDGQEPAEYAGKWTVTVSAENAKGKYSVRLAGR